MTPRLTPPAFNASIVGAPSRCIHTLPLTTFFTQFRVTPIALAIEPVSIARKCKLQMRRTFSSSRTLFQTAAPFGMFASLLGFFELSGGIEPRPLFQASRMLSFAVPQNRWAGFMQRLLSHLWQMCIPLGIGPFAISYETRWASNCLSPTV